MLNLIMKQKNKNNLKKLPQPDKESKLILEIKIDKALKDINEEYC